MPHPRIRHAQPLLERKLKFSPVVTIQGARQTGKSFLVRQLLGARVKGLQYVTFDSGGAQLFASESPESFLAQHQDAHPLAIDEAQKVPALFDAIKLEVDRRRYPGRYLLLGSTEFSKQTLIRESLTGRMTRLRLYPLTLAESLALPLKPLGNAALIKTKPRVTRRHLMAYLQNGGLPGLFAVHDRAEQEGLFQDWIDLTTQRDAVLFPKVKIDPVLCARIFKAIATLEEPTASEVARMLKVDLRKVKTHIMVLEQLFALHRLDPHPLGTGKTWYFIFDVGIAAYLGASFERQLHTWAVLEQMAQRASAGERRSELYFYRASKGGIIHLVVAEGRDLHAVKILGSERFYERELNMLPAFREKCAKSKDWRCASLSALGGDRFKLKTGIQVYPWETLA
jgi:predicted AAA+ superfamily ATPase